MLAFKILGTIFVGFSCFTAMVKNINIFGGRDSLDDWFVAGTTVWGWLWRAFVIVALWII